MNIQRINTMKRLKEKVISALLAVAFTATALFAGVPLGRVEDVAAASVALSAPKQVKVVEVSYDSVRIVWQKVAGAAGYTVYWSNHAASGFEALANTKTTSTRSNGLIARKTYYYKVKAYRTEGATKVYGATSATVKAQTQAFVVDFSVSAADLKFVEEQNPSQTYVRPGYKIRISVKVKKSSHDAAGGGTAVLSLQGEVFDRVPFFVDKGKDYLWIYRSYQLPDGNVSTLSGPAGESGFMVQIIADDITRDPNLANNTAHLAPNVQVPAVALRTARTLVPDPPSDSSIASMKATSELGSGLAKPGGYLTLTTKIVGSGMKTVVDFCINDVIIKRKNVTPRGAGLTLSVTYYVPCDAQGELEYAIKLENGTVESIPVTIAAFDYEILQGGVSWNKKSDEKNYIPGQTIALRVRVLRMSKLSFQDTYGAVRVHFWINGKLSPGQKIQAPSGTTPYVGDVYYACPLPQKQASALKVKAIVDAGGLYAETNEKNNARTVTIPIKIGGQKTNDASIVAQRLRYAPSTALAGGKVEFIVTVKNNAGTYPTKAVALTYKINDAPIAYPDGEINRTYLAPGQHYTTVKMWTVPSNVTGELKLTVILDPKGALTGDDKSDNTASVFIPVSRAELGVAKGSLGANALLFSNRENMLYARVYNYGPVAAKGVDVAFYQAGVEVSRSTIDLADFSRATVYAKFTIPQYILADDALPLSGVDGYVNPPINTRNIDFSVKIDPDKHIPEFKETDNTITPKSMVVYTLSTKGFVHAEINDLSEVPIQGALVSINAGGTIVNATSDANGIVTFLHVPYGTYDLTVTKTGYRQGKSYDEELFTGNREDATTVYLDDRSALVGKITTPGGTPLPDAKVYQDGDYHRQSVDAGGNYSIQLAAGTYTMKYICPGYQTRTESVTIGAGVDLTKNVTMQSTTFSSLKGKVFDQQAVALNGITVYAKNIGGTTLATAVSDALGNYEMQIPLASLEMWVSIQSSYDGLGVSQGIYMTRGFEETYDLYFIPYQPPKNYEATGNAKVAPWVVCASMPGTFFNPDYKVESIYGLFEMSLHAKVEDENITNFSISTTPDFWVNASVSSSWNPAEIFAVNPVIESYNTIAAILPTGIPLAVSMHSTNKTLVRIRKVVIISDDEVLDSIYCDVTKNYSYSPNKLINWENCKVKLYLKIDPDNGVANPAAGYGKDRVLVEWNPKTNTFIKLGNYVVYGKNPNTNEELYMDE
ncbi:MAG: carboxypeptidase regulatory-like domain-containing protein [Clostridia bacterium]